MCYSVVEFPQMSALHPHPSILWSLLKSFCIFYWPVIVFLSVGGSSGRRGQETHGDTWGSLLGWESPSLSCNVETVALIAGRLQNEEGLQAIKPNRIQNGMCTVITTLLKHICRRLTLEMNKQKREQPCDTVAGMGMGFLLSLSTLNLSVMSLYRPSKEGYSSEVY